MSAVDFLPRREADVRDWSIVFDKHITTNPAAFGLTVQDVDEYHEKHLAFLAAYATAKNSTTRTRPTILRKNDALAALRRAARKLSRRIHSLKIASNELKQAAGLTINRPGGRSPRTPMPSVAPSLTITPLRSGIAGEAFEVRLGNTLEPERTGKPTGVTSATIMRCIGARPSSKIADWDFVGQTTRTKTIVAAPIGIPAGQTLWITACWNNTRMVAGPWATPMCAFPASRFAATQEEFAPSLAA